MRTPSKTILTLASCAILFVVPNLVQAKKKSKRIAAPAPEAAVEEASSTVRIRLVDGSAFAVDEAWESGQGVWYRRGGMTQLIPRDRVKRIERSSAEQAIETPAAPKVVVADQPQTASVSDDQPVWIYLVGGAKVEADGASESAAGVWYRRGTLSIFIDRKRVDHIERESEALADSGKKERGWTTGNQKIDSLIRQNGAKHGVDPYLIFCVMEQESHFNSRALSPKGARGLMQLMPGTAARFGVNRPSDPAQNISGGTRYLKQLLGQFNGRIDLVLASYNAGEGAVLKFGRRVPPYRETRNYVQRISYRYRKAKSKETAPAAPKAGSTRAVTAAGL